MTGVYRDLLPHLARYRGTYFLGALCVLGSVALKVWIPLLVGDALEALRGAKAGVELAPDEVRTLVVTASLLIVGSALGTAFLRTTSRILILGNCRRVSHDLRNVVFGRLLKLAPSFFVRNPVGQIMSRTINDMRIVQSLAGPVLMYLAENTTLFVFCLVVMAQTDPLLAALALGPYPIFLWFARRLAMKIQVGSLAVQEQLGELSSLVDENLSGQTVIKTLGLQRTESERFEEECRAYRRLNLTVTGYRALLVPLLMTLTSLSTVLLLGFGAPRIFERGFGLDEWIPMIIYVQLLAGPTRSLGFVISTLRRGRAALGRIREILTTELEIREPVQPVTPTAREGRLAVRELSVRYPPLSEQPHLTGSLPDFLAGQDSAEGFDKERLVLDRVSFEVPPGRTLGIVGHTGAGKTSLVRILSRQLAVADGTVFLDGVDLNALELDELRARVGYVPQEAFLFSRSLADNVALGRPDAGRDEVEAALRSAHFRTDLEELPDGIDTLVGERGVNLSGGQRQRVALARVMLCDPLVLILDDTLSAVDTHTADAILAELRPYASRRTTLIVAHRLSTVQHADEILVLAEGRIAERGTHAELLEAGAIYADLWERQQRHEAEADELGLELRTEET